MHQRRGLQEDRGRYHDDRDDRHRHHDHRHRDDERRHQHHHASPSGRAQQSQQSRHRDLADHRADLRLFKPGIRFALSRRSELVCCELPFRWPFPFVRLGGLLLFTT